MMNNGLRSDRNKFSIVDHLLYAPIKERSVRCNIKFGIPITPITFRPVKNSLINFKMPEIKPKDFENCNNLWIGDFANGWDALLDSNDDIIWVKQLKGQLLYKKYVQPSTLMIKSCTQDWVNFDSNVSAGACHVSKVSQNKSEYKKYLNTIDHKSALT